MLQLGNNVGKIGILLVSGDEICYMDSWAGELLQGVEPLTFGHIWSLFLSGMKPSVDKSDILVSAFDVQGQSIFATRRMLPHENDLALITVQSSADNLLLFLMEDVLDELCIMDGRGITQWVSKGWLQKHHVRGDEILGKSAEYLEKEGIFKPSVTLEVLQKKARASIVQYNKNGERILATGVPIFGESGEILWVVSYSTWDINNFNDLKKKYAALRRQSELYSAELENLRGQNMQIPEVISESPQMKKALALIRKVAPTDIYIMITGETGVGKNLIAKTIHHNGSNPTGPFVEINCGAIPENLLESELFGYTEGAFTGASKKGKVGLIEMANNGTLFLDEIGDMPLSLQVKLLRTIQSKEITRIGDVNPIKVDFRLITATNKDLKKMVQQEKFRMDLFYRISVVPIHIPALRERPEDLEQMINQFTFQFNEKYGVYKKLSFAAKQQLMSYSWPGNVRELQNVLEQIIVTTEGDYIEHIETLENISSGQSDNLPECIDLNSALENYEAGIVRRAYQQCGSTVGVSKLLHISQPTAARKISKYVTLKTE